MYILSLCVVESLIRTTFSSTSIRFPRIMIAMKLSSALQINTKSHIKLCTMATIPPYDHKQQFWVPYPSMTDTSQFIYFAHFVYSSCTKNSSSLNFSLVSRPPNPSIVHDDPSLFYDGFHQWTIDNNNLFWALLWEFFKIKAFSPPSNLFTPIQDDLRPQAFSKPRLVRKVWFEGSRLNYAENIFRLLDAKPHYFHTTQLSNTILQSNNSTDSQPKCNHNHIQHNTAIFYQKNDIDSEYASNHHHIQHNTALLGYQHVSQNNVSIHRDKLAIVFRSETLDLVSRMGPSDLRHAPGITYGQLESKVMKFATGLRNLGLQKGDVVAAIMPNLPETIISMLACAAIGALWTSCAPDFGLKAIVDRIGQINPKILIFADGYYYKSKKFSILDKAKGVIDQVKTLSTVIYLPYIFSSDRIQNSFSSLSHHVNWTSFFNCDKQPIAPFRYEQLPFDHPLFIMYSSGTTGLPKCMVQSAMGVLLNQVKEHSLHLNITENSTLFYFTSTGWMMWNWMVAALAIGAKIILYDGAPVAENPSILLDIVRQEKVTHFGTSARYIQALEDMKVDPLLASRTGPGSLRQNNGFPYLQSILVTGSPSMDNNYAYVRDRIGKHVHYVSMSGGTDINGCFALGTLLKPVYPRELQCFGLGMDVRVIDDDGKALINKEGELSCFSPVPSMPLYFWNDPNDKKYMTSYFEKYPNVWCHGDFAIQTIRKGLIILGRSDATMNPGGVRIGSADIYQVMENISEIQDSIVVGQSWQGDDRVILFVVMRPGKVLNEAFVNHIKSKIQTALSPRHVPKLIFAVKSIPYTFNMKKVEIAVKRLVDGKEIKNRDSIANPESLDEIVSIMGLIRKPNAKL